MENFTNKLAEKLTPIANKVASIKFLQALTKTFQAVIPITMIGAFACLFAWIPIEPWQNLLAANTQLLYFFYTVQSLTLSIIAVYVMMFLPYLYAKTLDIKNPIVVVPVAFASFLMITPTELFSSIPSTWLGYSGMFSAFIVSWTSVRIVWLCFNKRIVIRMPKGVPEFVEAAFAIFLPAVFSICLFAAIGILMSNTSYGSLHQFIYTILQAPLSNVTDTYPGLLISYMVSSLACFLGIHAESVTPHISMFTVAFDAENLAAYQAGEAFPRVFGTAVACNTYIGGMGATLGLGILLLIVAKSQRYKKLARVAILPQIFNIAEPLLFGMPIMLNPICFIPYMLTIMVNITVSYWVVALNIFARSVPVSMSWTVPVVIQSAVNFASPLQGVLLNLFIMALDMLIWYPFVRILDKRAILEEQAETNNEIEAA